MSDSVVGDVVCDVVGDVVGEVVGGLVAMRVSERRYAASARRRLHASPSMLHRGRSARMASADKRTHTHRISFLVGGFLVSAGSAIVASLFVV